jgi:hypothetical protein
LASKKRQQLRTNFSIPLREIRRPLVTVLVMLRHQSREHAELSRHDYESRRISIIDSGGALLYGVN